MSKKSSTTAAEFVAGTFVSQAMAYVYRTEESFEPGLLAWFVFFQVRLELVAFELKILYCQRDANLKLFSFSNQKPEGGLRQTKPHRHGPFG